MPFIDLENVPTIEPVPGCRLKTPHGEQLMLSYLEMDAGAEIPWHSHPHEQAGIVLEGRLELSIGEETRTLEPGSMFFIPSNVRHRAAALDGPVRVLDTFSPIRSDYAELASGLATQI